VASTPPIFMCDKSFKGKVCCRNDRLGLGEVVLDLSGHTAGSMPLFSHTSSRDYHWRGIMMRHKAYIGGCTDQDR